MFIFVGAAVTSVDGAKMCHAVVEILVYLTSLLLEILPLAMGKLTKQTCLGQLAANAVPAYGLQNTSCQDPLGVLFETSVGLIG